MKIVLTACCAFVVMGFAGPGHADGILKRYGADGPISQRYGSAPKGQRPQQIETEGGGVLVDPRTGTAYVRVDGGVVDSRTGKFYPRAGAGYIDPSTGRLLQAH